MNIVAIIQARLASTRLPAKVLKNISGKPMLAHIVDRLSYSQRINDIIIATSNADNDRKIVSFAQDAGINVFTGSENNVLERYLLAATSVNSDIIIRITGDCPLIDPMIVDQMIEFHLGSDVDYTSNLAQRTFPRGLDAEVFSMEALQKTYQFSTSHHHREHVTPFIYENPGIFRVQSFSITGPLRRPDLRLCVDTPEDFSLIEEIYRRFYEPNHFVDIHTAICWLDSEPYWKSINVAAEEEHMLRNQRDGVIQQKVIKGQEK